MFPLVALALLALIVFLALGGGDDETSQAEEGSAATAEKAPDPKTDRRSLVPKQLPDQPAEKAPDPAKSPFTMQIAEEPALSGIELAPSTDEDRTRAGVTDRYGRGVTITRIHPDSSAAEVELEVGDVIVRAQKEHVNSVEDLKRIVGDRDHTVVNFMRQGQLMSVVLQPPYQKPAP
jgi:hypothetical protein